LLFLFPVSYSCKLSKIDAKFDICRYLFGHYPCHLSYLIDFPLSQQCPLLCTQLLPRQIIPHIQHINPLLLRYLNLKFIEFVFKHLLQLALIACRVSNQILTPVIIDHGYVLFEVEVLDHHGGQVVVAEAQHQAQDVLRLELIELLIGDGAGAIRGVTQLSEHDEGLHLVDVVVAVKGTRGLWEGLREGGRT
jgi:hypothetical protein